MLLEGTRQKKMSSSSEVISKILQWKIIRNEKLIIIFTIVIGFSFGKIESSEVKG